MSNYWFTGKLFYSNLVVELQLLKFDHMLHVNRENKCPICIKFVSTSKLFDNDSSINFVVI